ncbi:MAG TPA: hypothetical protein VD997_10350 [Phycisphaerales bacterium]|nr:hypothetical protein [Phycisphaerales bacterium]
MLFLVALPLISVGATRGPRFMVWAGLVALCLAALIPPVQRLVCGGEETGEGIDAAGSTDTKEAKP